MPGAGAVHHINTGREQVQQHRARKARLFDHLVGAGQQRQRNIDAELLAVCRLMRNWSLVARMTGRSAAFSPFTIRPTYIPACPYVPLGWPRS